MSVPLVPASAKEKRVLVPSVIVKVPVSPIEIPGVVEERVMGVAEEEVKLPLVEIEILDAKSEPVIELARFNLE